MTLDDKSGYDHIFIHPDSRKYFGIQFGGWYMVFNTLPFGFKASAVVYNTTGMIPISYCRSLGIPSLLYIDDRLVCEMDDTRSDSYCNAVRSICVMCKLLVSLGYYHNLLKCNIIPSRCVKFLGMIVNSEKLAFIPPEHKKQTFRILRESMLKEIDVDLRTLQRFAGKCISLYLAIPSARLFSREVNRAISKY
ncbi:unnamed protein product [Mytilus coruscus]|uniref:Reverse transcriptase domain-containing protein n=1 Tax=Mytilus coruscus TaxID=42192 RepID=A0A6J8AMB4_MYTCO|nr:unnamed protein product [Mytilus coruscus]